MFPSPKCHIYDFTLSTGSVENLTVKLLVSYSKSIGIEKLSTLSVFSLILISIFLLIFNLLSLSKITSRITVYKPFSL